jgi:hypothetical protein
MKNERKCGWGSKSLKKASSDPPNENTKTNRVNKKLTFFAGMQISGRQYNRYFLAGFCNTIGFNESSFSQFKSLINKRLLKNPMLHS